MMKKLWTVPLSMCLLLTMISTAFAADFTPSVVGKAAPNVVISTTQSGAEAAAIIRDAQGNELAGVPVGELIVTPVSQASQASEDIRTMLTNAYDQIINAETLDELSSELASTLLQLSDEVGVEDLVVRDLFDVSVTGTYEELLNEAGNSITVTFDLGLDPDALLIVLHNIQGSEWETVPEDRIQREADGSVNVTFNSLSPVAFVVDSAEVAVDPNAPTSPQTGEKEVAAPALLAAVVLAMMAAGIVTVGKRRKN